MSAIASIVWFALTIWVSRIMYGKWRQSILNRAGGSSSIYSREWQCSPSVTSRLVWAAFLSFFITLAALPFVGITMAIMWRPPKSESEKRQEVRDRERETERERMLLNAQLEQSRADLDQYRATHPEAR